MTAADAVCLWVGRTWSALILLAIGSALLAAAAGRFLDWREQQRRQYLADVEQVRQLARNLLADEPDPATVTRIRERVMREVDEVQR